MKAYQWNITGTDGAEHSITLETDFLSNRFCLAVDGTVREDIRPGRRHYFSGFTKHTLSVGGKTCHLVSTGARSDLAVEGKFLDCGLPYVPYPPIPKFLSLYLILCALSCVLGGLLTWVVGLTALIRCGRAATSPFLDRHTKLVTCATTTVASWAISAMIALVLHLLAG